MLGEYRMGALTVVQEVSDRDFIQRRLRGLDDRLFVEQQLTFDNERVWCVMLTVGLSEPPRCVFEWRNADGRPIRALTEGIVQEVERMMKRGPLDMQAIDEANRRLVARHEQRAREAHEEIARDFERLARRSSAIPRSPTLAATRRRQRASQPSSPSKRAAQRGPEL